MFDTIEPEPIVFVEWPFLMASTFHLLTGVKNSGKGTWLASVAARVTLGQLGARDRVIWLALGEDNIARDVIPRLLAHDGDRSKVGGLVNADFTLPSDGQWLEDMVHEQNAGMVVIDPLGGALLGRDSNGEEVVRPALQALNRVAEQTGAMVFGVRHISNKRGARSEGGLSAVLGHSDWVNIPRAILALLHDDEEASYRHLFLLTGNLVADGQVGQLLVIEGIQILKQGAAHPRIVVLGESGKDPDELLSKRKTTGGARAKKLILLMLLEAGGVCESDTLDYQVSKLTGLATRTLREVRTEMKDRGLTKLQPIKDEAGAILSWQVSLTAPGRLEASSLTSPSKPLGLLDSARARGDTPDRLWDLGGKSPANGQRRSPENTASGHLQGEHKNNVDSGMADPLSMLEAFNPKDDVS